ncbi:MAG: ComEC/Rec2 family competence protein [Bacteroidota bacterium]
MSVWSSYPFVRITIAFGMGIILPELFNFTTQLVCLVILLLIFYCCYISFKTTYPKILAVFYGLIILTTFVVLGAIRSHLETSTHQSNHLSNINLRHYESFYLIIDGFPVEKPKHFIYQATALGGLIDSTSNDPEHHLLEELSGHISLYISKDSIYNAPLKYGDIITCLNTPFSIQAPKNPHEFNYSAYMARKGIHHQLFLDSRQFRVVSNQPANWLVELSHNARLFFKKSLFTFIPKKSSRDIALALILGIKDDLDKDLKAAYSAAGAMHVLAVSGLHVGIIHMILSWSLGFLKRYRFGRMLFLTLSLLALWGYAFITGLSPSVLRAVIMFSVVLIGNNTLRFHNIYNSLAVSAFLILLYNPFMLMEVGFQLSYTAVLGIVYLQPKIFGLLTIKNYLLNKIWAITCVSLAAQAATFPIGLYYFHQFPTYFLVSNLIVIPAAFIILLNGLAVLFFSTISDFLSMWAGKLLDTLINLLNQAVLLLNQLPISLIDWIRLDTFQLLTTYFVMISLILLFKNKKSRYLKISFFTCLIFISLTGHQSIVARQKKEIVFYEIRNNNVIDFIHKGSVKSYLSDGNIDSDLINYQIGPNRLANSLPKFNLDQQLNSTIVSKLGEVIIWEGYKIMILNKDIRTISTKNFIDADVLVLSGNHFIDPKKIKSIFQFKHLIIDSTYKKYRSEGLSKALDREQINHWNINTDGAFILQVNNQEFG